MKAFIKKISICVFATLVMLCMLAVLCACGGSQGGGSRVVVCDHNYQETVVSPTCTRGGYTLHKCTKCGDSYQDNIVAALGHKPSAAWEANATEHWHECENGCGERAGVGEHTFDTGVVEAEATCETNGRIVYTCTTCGFQRADVLPKKGHKLLSGWKSNQDSHWHECENDRNERVDYALHSWDAGFVERPATCENTGVIVYTCTVCGKSVSRDIPRTDHKKSSEWESNDTLHWRTCQTCGDKFDSASHTLEEVTYAKVEPTCTEPGVTVYRCTVCRAVIRVPIPALGHQKTTKWYSDKESHWHKCAHSGCDEKFDYGTHHFDAGTIYREPTCTSNGFIVYTCSDCGYKDYVTIPALGHEIDTSVWKHDEKGHWHECSHDCGSKFDYAEHEYEVTVVPPTAEEQGYTLHRCECGYEWKDEFVPATGS